MIDQARIVVIGGGIYGVNITYHFAKMGQTDLALEYLEKAVEAREVNLAFIRNDPDLEPLFADPRFLDLLQRAGIKPPASD